MSLPPDSPLLRSRTASPALQRARSVLVDMTNSNTTATTASNTTSGSQMGGIISFPVVFFLSNLSSSHWSEYDDCEIYL